MTDRRRETRMDTLYHARVYDIRTGELAGYLVDVSRHGLRLMAPRPLDPGTNFALQFHCPNANGKPQTVTFKGQVRWCERDHLLDFWALGIYVLDNAEQLFSVFAAYRERICQPG